MSTDAIRLLAVAVFRTEDRILVARGTDPATGAAFYRPLGGGVEFGERAAQALARELREELGAEIVDGPELLGVLENVFEYAGRPRHEVVFVFDARFRDPALHDRDALPVVEPGAGWEPARWLSLAQLAAGPEPLVPDGLLALLGTPGQASMPNSRSASAS